MVDGLPRRLVRTREEGGDKVGLAKKGKGTKWMLVIDGNGLPLGFHLESANTAEVLLAEATLDTIAVPRPRGRPRCRPEKLVADRAYDSREFRCALRRRGIGMCIPPKRRPAKWRPKRGRPVVACKEDYRQRYKVEHSFAWLGNFRRLLIRWERLFSVYRSGLAFAVMLLCVRRATTLACPIPLGYVGKVTRGRCTRHERSTKLEHERLKRLMAAPAS